MGQREKTFLYADLPSPAIEHPSSQTLRNGMDKTHMSNSESHTCHTDLPHEELH